MFFSWIPMVVSVNFNILSQNIPTCVQHIKTYAHMFY